MEGETFLTDKNGLGTVPTHILGCSTDGVTVSIVQMDVSDLARLVMKEGEPGWTFTIGSVDGDTIGAREARGNSIYSMDPQCCWADVNATDLDAKGKSILGLGLECGQRDRRTWPNISSPSSAVQSHSSSSAK